MADDQYVCTDCGDEMLAEDRQAHMRDAHHVAYALPEAQCWICGVAPCERMTSGG